MCLKHCLVILPQEKKSQLAGEYWKDLPCIEKEIWQQWSSSNNLALKTDRLLKARQLSGMRSL